MKAYRLYLIGPDGHFAKVEVIEAANDAAAIVAAAQLIGGNGAELWELDRRVRTFSTHPKRPGPSLSLV
jgi:hypothetical protein